MLHLQVNTSDEGSGDIKGVATSPSGAMTELLTARLDHHEHHISFTPDEMGQSLLIGAF